MSRGLLGYGRYPDGHIGCPRARSDMTPCIARDGGPAADSSDPPVCVGCGKSPYELLVQAVDVLSRVRDVPSEFPAAGGADRG